MIKRALLGLAIAVLAMPATAQDWGRGFSMGSLLASGGSDANGALSFECTEKGSDSGFDTEGQPVMELTPMVGVTLSKKRMPEEGINFWVGDEQSYLVPMTVEPGGKSLSYEYSPDSVQSVRDLVAALRQGDRVAAYAGGLEGTRLLGMTLEGSSDALEFIEGCIAE